MQRFKFVCLAAFLLISSVAFAAEQTVTGKIKSVDVAKNSITLNDLPLDVTRKTKITVDGKNATLGELKVGRSADVKYDDVLDAAITISVENDAVTNQPRTKTKAEEISLLANDSLDGWKPLPAEEKSQWTLKKGILRLDIKGPSLVTEEKFSDFDLHFEFKLPSKAASGVFLRGRYEIQLVDSDFRTKEGKPLDPISGCGSIWGQIAPSKNVYRGPNKWNTMDVKLTGNVVTIRMNDELIIDARTLNGVTRGALDAFESEPGPIIVQNSEISGIEFRNITITPSTEAESVSDDSTSDDSSSTLPKFEGAESLIAADSLEGWYFKEEIKDNKPNWEVKTGVLTYKSSGPSLISDKKYGDFEMQAEFKLPKDCNCGIFLRGRYELKLTDTPKNGTTSLKPDGRIGAIYSRITPSKNAYKGTNEWNTLEVKLIDKNVTVKINGETVIDAKEIKGGPTGPGVDHAENTPGPLMLFAHPKGVGAKFRNIKIKPLDQ